MAEIVLSLDGNVAVVTGASRGIGYATAVMFARLGAVVMMASRNEEALEGACRLVRETTGNDRVEGIPCDVTSADSVRDLFQRVYRQHKRLDTLVANAGVLDDALIGMVSAESIETTFATNTFGVLYCNQYASRLMARSGGGSIINVASIIGTHGNVGQAVYGGSKAAVIGITKSLAKELAPQNIRVNAVAPGFIDTEMTRAIPEKMVQQRVDSIAMGRVGTPEDVARVIVFLASELAGYVTGQTIGVDGGMLV